MREAILLEVPKQVEREEQLMTSITGGKLRIGNGPHQVKGLFPFTVGSRTANRGRFSA